jgi:hypothetical protein
MLCAPLNQNLQRQMTSACHTSFNYKDEPVTEIYFSYDFDNVRYTIKATPDRIIFGFFCEDLKVIWDYAGRHIKEKYYAGSHYR